MNTAAADDELIALQDRVARKDAAALKTLYDLCSSKLYGLAMRVVSQREWAEDVLQEASARWSRFWRKSQFKDARK